MQWLARLFRRIHNFFAFLISPRRPRNRILGPTMADTGDPDGVRTVDPNEPYKLQPLKMTEICCHEDEDEDDDDRDVYWPYPRSGHRVVCIGHSLYSFGGYNPDVGEDGGRTLFGELWKFDLANYRWSLLLGPDAPGMPKELASMTMCASGNYILIYGGSGLPFGHHNSNRLHLIDTTQSPPTFREVQTFGEEKPPELYGQSMILLDQYLYVVGGTSGFDYTCDLHRLDLQTCTWSFIGPSRPRNGALDPEGRYRHELATDKEHIIVFGGGTTTETFPLDVLPAFHLPTGEWINFKTRPDPKGGVYPLPRKFHSLVQCQDQVYICGGCNSNVILRDMWRLDLQTRTWTKLDKCRLPYRLFFHDAAVTPDGCMFIFGGVRDQTGATRTNNLYKLWVTVPPLKSIAAEAVRFWIRSEEADESSSNGVDGGISSVVAKFKAMPHWQNFLL